MKTTPMFEVKETGKYGNGVFALRDIKKGETVWVLSGEVIGFEECIERVRSGKENQADSLQVDIETDMDLDELSRTFNHSCIPTCGLRNTSELVALRDINSGEEITYDYSATIGPNIPMSLWHMECQCGSEKCRKIIGNVLTIPSEQLQKYRDADALQDYIIKELDIIESNGGRLPNYRSYEI